jgi:hypothetical protein
MWLGNKISYYFHHYFEYLGSDLEADKFQQDPTTEKM